MWVRRIVGVVLCLVGAVWGLQGAGVIGGSFMSGEIIWAVIGGLVIGFGIAVLRPTKKVDDEGDPAR
jgi:hypothetical protein